MAGAEVSGPTRWVVRRGTERGKGEYLRRCGCCWWYLDVDSLVIHHRIRASAEEQRDNATDMRADDPKARVECRVVAILTHEQAKAKAAATSLRIAAGWTTGATETHSIARKTRRDVAAELNAQADRLWPKRGGR